MAEKFKNLLILLWWFACFLVNWHLDTLGSEVKPFSDIIYGTRIEYVFMAEFHNNKLGYRIILFTYQNIKVIEIMRFIQAHVTSYGRNYIS